MAVAQILQMAAVAGTPKDEPRLLSADAFRSQQVIGSDILCMAVTQRPRQFGASPEMLTVM
jgi:hypothetical protein